MKKFLALFVVASIVLSGCIGQTNELGKNQSIGTGNVKEFVVKISGTGDKIGFNGDPNLVLKGAKVGDTMKIEFKNVDPLSKNPHAIEIVDPDGKIIYSMKDPTFSGQSQTVEFVVAKSGTYWFRCFSMCKGHGNLQNGQLLVE